MELNDVLKEETPETQEVVEAPKEEAPEVEKAQSKRKLHQEREQRARDEGGKFVKEEEPKPEVKEEPKPEPKQEMSEKERAFLAAAQEERRKRQELERRLAQMEQPKAEDKKTFWDDPEGHLKSFEEKLVQERIQTKLQTTEAIARSKYQDFDEKVQVFAEILQTTPGLHAQWMQAPDPAEFAYRLGKHTKELRDVGSIDALREKVRKEERLKIEAEFKKRQEELEKQRSDLTPSLSDVRGAARRTAPVFTGPTPLDDILAAK